MNEIRSRQVRTGASRTHVEYALLFVLLASVVVAAATALGLFTTAPVATAAA